MSADIPIDGKTITPGGHLWGTRQDGEIDYYRFENDPHAGPMCLLCYAAPCMNCREPMDGPCRKNQENTLPGMEY